MHTVRACQNIDMAPCMVVTKIHKARRELRVIDSIEYPYLLMDCSILLTVAFLSLYDVLQHPFDSSFSMEWFFLQESLHFQWCSIQVRRIETRVTNRFRFSQLVPDFCFHSLLVCKMSPTFDEIHTFVQTFTKVIISRLRFVWSMTWWGDGRMRGGVVWSLSLVLILWHQHEMRFWMPDIRGLNENTLAYTLTATWSTKSDAT